MRLPDAILRRVPGDAIANAFHARGVERFCDACALVHALPYGRNRDRADYRLVLDEGRGTCSTKHALLAALAHEQELPVDLRVGLFMMDDANTPGVGPALEAHGLAAIPEAHCYLFYDGARVDLTHPGTSGALQVEILVEEPIMPEGIGAQKLALHRGFLERWSRERGVDFRAVWQAREACIAALSAAPSLGGMPRA